MFHTIVILFHLHYFALGQDKKTMFVPAKVQENMRRHWTYLLDNLDPMPVVQRLVDEQAIKFESYTELKEAGSRRLQGEHLLDKIMHGPNSLSDMFDKCLQLTNQKAVADHIYKCGTTGDAKYNIGLTIL